MHYSHCVEGTIRIHGSQEESVPTTRAPKYEYRPDCIDWARRRSIQNSLDVIYTSMRAFQDVPYPAAHMRRMFLTYDIKEWEQVDNKKDLEKKARRVSRELVNTRNS